MDKEVLKELAEMIDYVSKLPSGSPELKPLEKMLAELDRGLPPATSGEVLNSACKW